jgi:hypothetical protein
MRFIKNIFLITVVFTSALILSCSPTIPVESPDDLEYTSVWQYLKVYSIYQDNILDNPFKYSSIQSMFNMLGDTLKGYSYTCFVNSDLSTISNPYSVLEKSALSSENAVVFDSLTDSCCSIKIATFMNYSEPGVFDQFKAILTKVAPFKKIIFDLRQNTGGDLEITDSITQMILPAGIKYIRSRERNYDELTKKASTNEYIWETTRGQAVEFRNKQFAVLIDGMTASASEILALALKDGINVPMFGVRSYGKGIGQIFLERRDHPWLKVTFMHLYRMKDSSDYHRIGISPDSVPADIKLSGISESDKPLYYAIKTLQPSVEKGKISYPLYKTNYNIALAKDVGMYRIVKAPDLGTEN